jgi:superfamily II DNA or RNA helicase
MIERKGGDLFIVDNSNTGWTGLRYLKEWTDIAKSFDIATGYFDIGALLELDGKWQQLQKIRILMGDEATQKTRAALFEAIKTRSESFLNNSIELDKEKNPFLNGVPAIVDALKSGQIECRIYNKDKFHAKAYITHAKIEVVGAQALVGSSNFTRPGLTQNVELNIQIQSGREVAQLQDWFDAHWEEAKEVTDDILNVISRHTKEFTPFEVYTKALHEFFKGHEMTAGEWEETGSRMFHVLDRYQKEAYWALMKIAKQHGGAFLCDGVGLGKTFVGLMLIERLILHDGKRVVLFAPKGAKEGVWVPHLYKWLPHIGGIAGGSDFSNLAVFSHTDLNRGGDFPSRFRRITELADTVIIDEAHHFRNPGRKGDPETGEGKSRYYQLFDLLDNSVRPKNLFMLTATPINNQISDFRHMAELFTRGDEAYFARTVGVNNLRGHFIKLEKSLRNHFETDSVNISENLTQIGDFLSGDSIIQSLVVQRSRAYAVESQQRESGSNAIFPKRMDPRVAEYSVFKTYGHLLDMIEKAFAKDKPLFSLPIYFPLAYYKGDDENIDPMEEGRQKQVVSLIRTQFLKRFESSVRAFELSSYRLLLRLLAFLEVHSDSKSEKLRLERWKNQNTDFLNWAQTTQLKLWGTDYEDEWEEDVVPLEMLHKVEKLSREEYKVEEIMQETFLDLDQIVNFIRETKKFKPKNDDKLKKLKRLLNSKDLKDQKVIVFTEFADTARYLYSELTDDGIDGLVQIDGATSFRQDVIERFSPYYNGTNSKDLKKQGKQEIRVLISTDVLSEGLNLQDACRMINYDIHWNPVRLMQRIGRVDRRMDPEVEKRLIADKPEMESVRGKILYWNFLPPDELNSILSLYNKVTNKTLLISKTLGIEGKKLLTPEDDYDALREFNSTYEGRKSMVEEMHLEYQELMQEMPELYGQLNSLPGSIFSGKKTPAKGTAGVFFCYSLPALDKETNEFTEEAGTTRWYLYDISKECVIEEPRDIIKSIRSKPGTPRKCTTEKTTLIEIRKTVLKHIKNTYLKRIDAPLGIKPILKCWMELNEG